MLSNEVILDVDELALVVNPLKSVTSITVVEAPAHRCTVVAKEHQTRVIGLRSVTQEIKQSVLVEQEVLRVTPLRADDIRSLNRVSAEENGEVEADDVVVPFLRVELDGESAGIPSFIGEFSAESDGREANKDWCLLPGRLEKIRFLIISSVPPGSFIMNLVVDTYGQIGHVLCDFKKAEGAAAAGVDHP